VTKSSPVAADCKANMSDGDQGEGPRPFPVFRKIGTVIVKAVIEHPMMPADAVMVRADGVLFYGKGTDIERMLFELSLTPQDRKFLTSLKISV
jgi:hypothetical protein